MLSSTSIHPEQQQAERDNNLLLFCWFFFFFWKKLQTKDKLTVQCSHNALVPPQTPQLSPSAPQWEPYWMLWDSLGGCNTTQFPPGPSSCPEQPEGRTRSQILVPEEAGSNHSLSGCSLQEVPPHSLANGELCLGQAPHPPVHEGRR